MIDKNIVKQDIEKMYLEEKDNRCYKCIYFQYYPVTGAGAPERVPHWYCDLLEEGHDCTCSRTQVRRTIECVLCDYKTIEE